MLLDVAKETVEKFKEKFFKAGAFSADVAKVRIVAVGAKPDARVAADRNAVAEALLQMLGRDVVQLVKLRRRAAPHVGGLHGVAIVRLVPNFPVADVVVIAVCPPLVVVADDVLADHRPFRGVLGREDTVRLQRLGIFDRDAQTEERLAVNLHQLLDQAVGENKIVGCRVVGVGVKVAEQIRNIRIEVAAERTAHVVQTRVGDSRLLQVMKHRKVPAGKRRLSDTVHGLDGADRF